MGIVLMGLGTTALLLLTFRNQLPSMEHLRISSAPICTQTTVLSLSIIIEANEALSEDISDPEQSCIAYDLNYPGSHGCNEGHKCIMDMGELGNAYPKFGSRMNYPNAAAECKNQGRLLKASFSGVDLHPFVDRGSQLSCYSFSAPGKYYAYSPEEGNGKCLTFKVLEDGKFDYNNKLINACTEELYFMCAFSEEDIWLSALEEDEEETLENQEHPEEDQEFPEEDQEDPEEDQEDPGSISSTTQKQISTISTTTASKEQPLENQVSTTHKTGPVATTVQPVPSHPVSAARKGATCTLLANSKENGFIACGGSQDFCTVDVAYSGEDFKLTYEDAAKDCIRRGNEVNAASSIIPNLIDFWNGGTPWCYPWSVEGKYYAHSDPKTGNCSTFEVTAYGNDLKVTNTSTNDSCIQKLYFWCKAYYIGIL